MSSPNRYFKLSNEVRVSQHKPKLEHMNTVEKVVKYLTVNKDQNDKGISTSRKLITSDGVTIDRGRIRSNTNASTSSQSRSKTRKQFGNFSKSKERSTLNSRERVSVIKASFQDSNILIQNFMEAAGPKGNQRKQRINKEHSVEISQQSNEVLVCAPKTLSGDSKLRKSYDESQFPTMEIEYSKSKYYIPNYHERRNQKLRERSNNKSEQSKGKYT